MFISSYYVLVATCVLARKTEWLRNAALAAALVFPAISGIHGIVLAAMDRKGGVDLDVYGALQFCAVGALTAPVTVRFSKTYFNTPGRNVIFLWTLIVLAGLMALTVEFFRLGPLPCADGGDGLPLYRLQDFEYGTTMCGLICSAEDGPHSPMRAGSANDIYVVPAPYVLTFGAATLIAAGSCIPPILSLISTWEKINFLNWQARWGRQRDVDSEPATSTNASEIHADCAGSPAEALGNTAQLNGVDNNLARGEVALPEPPPESTEQMMKINATIRELLNVIEFIIFSGAVVALIIVGEMNFWSEPLNYQTEPISNIGMSLLSMLLEKSLTNSTIRSMGTYRSLPTSSLRVIIHVACRGGYGFGMQTRAMSTLCKHSYEHMPSSTYCHEHCCSDPVRQLRDGRDMSSTNSFHRANSIRSQP